MFKNQYSIFNIQHPIFNIQGVRGEGRGAGVLY